MGYLNNNSSSTISINLNVDGKTIANVVAPYSDIINGNRLNLSERVSSLMPGIRKGNKHSYKDFDVTIKSKSIGSLRKIR